MIEMNKVFYPCKIEKDEYGDLAVQFLDVEEAFTDGDDLEDAKKNAKEVLSGVLGYKLDKGHSIPTPSSHSLVDNKNIFWISPDPNIALAIQLRLSREKANLTLRALSDKIGISYQSVQRLEKSNCNPSLKTISKVVRALGIEVNLSFGL